MIINEFEAMMIKHGGIGGPRIFFFGDAQLEIIERNTVKNSSRVIFML